MQEDCLICQEKLEYLDRDIMMECAICHKRENSKTRCINGHYVCNECHTQGIDVIISMCLEETSRNPIHIIKRMMDLPFCHMHGPEHHVMVGAALLTAYRNAGGRIDLSATFWKQKPRSRPWMPTDMSKTLSCEGVFGFELIIQKKSQKSFFPLLYFKQIQKSSCRILLMPHCDLRYGCCGG